MSGLVISIFTGTGSLAFTLPTLSVTGPLSAIGDDTLMVAARLRSLTPDKQTTIVVPPRTRLIEDE
jgi:hypothetical protein